MVSLIKRVPMSSDKLPHTWTSQWVLGHCGNYRKYVTQVGTRLLTINTSVEPPVILVNHHGVRG